MRPFGLEPMPMRNGQYAQLGHKIDKDFSWKHQYGSCLRILLKKCEQWNLSAVILRRDQDWDKRIKLLTWYITLFPEAVLVETTTCFPLRIDSIADTWWEYNEYILRECKAFDIICDIGGCKDPGRKIRCIKVGRWYFGIIPIWASFASIVRRSTIWSTYQLDVSISEMIWSIEGRSLGWGMVFKSSYKHGIFCLTGTKFLAAATKRVIGSSSGGVAIRSLSKY